MNKSSSSNIKEVKEESLQENFPWLNIRKALLLLLAFISFTGICTLFQQNTGQLPWKYISMALGPLHYPDRHSSFPVVDYPDCPGVHTWHTVSAITGNWLGLLGATYENVTFADQNCKLHKNFFAFAVAPAMPQVFGLKLIPTNTFDVTYSIALVQAGAKFKKLDGPGRKCVWVAAAQGPAYPDIRDLPYNGVTCLWERVDGVGENYQIDYWNPFSLV